MKKIIAMFVVMLACGMTANAQKMQTKKGKTPRQAEQVEPAKQQSYNEAAAKDVASLGAVVKFEGTQKEDFLRLFEYKHRMKADNMSDERKAVLSKSIEAKINATLTPDQNAKLAKNPKLIATLSN